jgi:hypothetical protein
MTTSGVPGTEAIDERGLKIKHATFFNEKLIDGVLFGYTQKVVSGIWKEPSVFVTFETLKLPVWLEGTVERDCKIIGVIEDEFIFRKIKGVV